MVELNLAQLLNEVSSDSPCGGNLEEDAVFLKLENVAKFVEERQMGDSILPAEEPDWKEVKTLALGLLEKTRDIQIAVHLTCALLRTDGFDGFSQGLSLIQEWLNKYWDSVYPTQDPEDDFPILRINTLSSLNDYVLIRKALNHIFLTQSVIGNFSWHDIEVTEGKKPPPKEGDPPEISLINAAFDDTDFETLQKLGTSVSQSLVHVIEINKIIIDKTGSVDAPDLSDVTNLLGNINKFITEKIQKRQVSKGVSSEMETGVVLEDVLEKASPNMNSKREGIHSRDDVVKSIDEMCSYFERYEPSSPVPFLLLRAKKLLTMNFMDILRDLTPDAVNQAENICGVKNNPEN